jgi:hypothetical protein
LKAEIEAILAGIPGVRVKPVGTLWSVVAGGIGGCRADGIGLARDIKAQHDYLKPRPIVEPEPAPEIMEAPVQVGHMDIPEELEIPRFLAPDPLEGIPDALQALAEPGETVPEMQARLWTLWRELNGKLMLNLAGSEEIALHTRLHNELHWIAPPIEGED